MKKMNKKGFTLIEMLAVIAIIAVLVSIVIPVVGNATEKAKEAADVANIRSAIAQVTTTALAGETVTPVPVAMTQGAPTFATQVDSIGGLTGDQLTLVAGAVKGKTVTIGWDATLNSGLGAVSVTVTDTPATPATPTTPTT